MFAIIETGGKQYKVAKGDKIKIEKIIGDFKPGAKIVFDKVLLTDDGAKFEVGMPYIKGAKVEATLEQSARYKKVDVTKFKAKSNYTRRKGHRQHYFEVKIEKIV